MSREPQVIHAKWPAPAHIKAFTTTRLGGFSKDCYSSLNLGAHVEDQQLIVTQNRNVIADKYHFSEDPLWLTQNHGTNVIYANDYTQDTIADAIISPNLDIDSPLVIMTADCLPILLCNERGTEFAAIHAGWRSLANGIVQNTVAGLMSPTDKFFAWLGPCISQKYFEVGEDVYNTFAKIDPNYLSAFESGKKPFKFLACLKTLACNQLKQLGVNQVFQSNECTYSNPKLYFSYRRDGITGRMGTFIYTTKPNRVM